MESHNYDGAKAMNVAVYNEDQLDCLQEICNIAMGRAADAVARQYGVYVLLSVPATRIVPAQEFAGALNSYQADDQICAATQLFESSRPGLPLSGLGMVMFSESSLLDLKSLARVPLTEPELVTKTCRLLAQTCLDALSSQWQLGFQCQPPAVIANNRVAAICESLTADWQQVLAVEINYRIKDREFNGNLLLLFPNQAIAAMAECLDELLV